MRSAKTLFPVWIVLSLLVCVESAHSAPQPRSPKEFFGFVPGSDRKLFDYRELVQYLAHLDSVSDRLQMRKVGKSPLGRDMYVAFISSEDNISRLSHLKQINQKLALEPAISESEREKLIQEGKVFIMATLSMHSSEVGPSQMLPLYAYHLVTTRDENILKQLSDVVWMVVPNHNPDGMDMIVKHYRDYLGTKYEGCSMPGVYHKYVGHDNNRDFVALTQMDTKVINRLFSTDWYPQVLVEKHQMGTASPRYFVPPNHDPIAENTDHGLLEWSSVFGSNLAKDMGERGLTGVATHWLFDNYWPGSTETSSWKNVISLLTEAASCKIGSPLFIEPTELSVFGKGLSEYKKSVNMPEPWPGGWWRLADIVQYELVSMGSLLKTASRQRKDILRFRNDLCRREVRRGQTQAPYYFVLPLEQHDRSELVRLINLLKEHGIQIYQLDVAMKLDGRLLSKGDLVVPLAQPYREFVKEALEHQVYPVRHYTPGGKVIFPYDITSWSLPLHCGVEAFEINTRSKELESGWSSIKANFNHPDKQGSLPGKFWALAYPAEANDSYRAAFMALAGSLEVSRLTGRLAWKDQKLSKGSFLIHFASRKRSALESIHREMEIEPVVLPNRVEVQAERLKARKIGLVETFFHDMDAGWTRYVFDQYRIPYKVLRPGDFESADLTDDFDVIVFPDARKDILLKGRLEKDDRYHPIDYPPQYRQGISDKGLAKLMTFIDQGGLVVSWARSTRLFMGELKLKAGKKAKPKDTFILPVQDLHPQLKKKGLRVPGSFLRALLVPDHPLTWGMREEIGVFSKGEPVLKTRVPLLDMDRRVIAKFPPKDILLSGHIDEREQLSNKPAMVWLRKGKGQLVLFGFHPQHRGSTPATYKLLFNALLLR